MVAVGQTGKADSEDEGGTGEVGPVQTRGGRADGEPGDDGHTDDDEQVHGQGQHGLVKDQKRHGVGADHHERAVSEGHLTGTADQELQARDGQHGVSHGGHA